MPAKSRPVVAVVLIAAVVAAVVWVTVWGTRTGSEPEGPAATSGSAEPVVAADGGAARIAELYESELSDVQVQGAGRVVRLLSDDVEGDRLALRLPPDCSSLLFLEGSWEDPSPASGAPSPKCSES